MSNSKDPSGVKELTDCCRASSYVRASAKEGLTTEERSTRPPRKLLLRHSLEADRMEAREAEFRSLRGELVRSEVDFLGSLLLSDRTEIGVSPAATRASMDRFRVLRELAPEP